MHAVRIHKNGGSSELTYEQVDKPTLKAGEVLVKNGAIGINYIDIYHRDGTYKLPLPLILGREGAGVVEQVGEGVSDFKVGDRVAYLAGGSYAEYVAVPTIKAYKLPDSVSFEIGASILLQGLTAHYLMRTTFPVGPNHTVLIHAGAGGLGQILIQACKHVGAKVITTVSNAEKMALVKSIGADHAINYTTEDFQAETRRLTGGKGVNVVYDSVGATTYLGSMNSLAPLGYLVLLGNASGVVPPIDPLLLSDKGSLFVTRPTLAHYTATPEIYYERCKEVFEWISSGAVKIAPPTTFSLKNVAEAHDFMSSRKATGKIVLLP